MIQIKINPIRCNGCRICETHLPGLIDKATDGVLLINTKNEKTFNPDAIVRAVAVCRMKALKLEAMQ